MFLTMRNLFLKSRTFCVQKLRNRCSANNIFWEKGNNDKLNFFLDKEKKTTFKEGVRNS